MRYDKYMESLTGKISEIDTLWKELCLIVLKDENCSTVEDFVGILVFDLQADAFEESIRDLKRFNENKIGTKKTGEEILDIVVSAAYAITQIKIEPVKFFSDKEKCDWVILFADEIRKSLFEIIVDSQNLFMES
jgi:hypothetical protein